MLARFHVDWGGRLFFILFIFFVAPIPWKFLTTFATTLTLSTQTPTGTDSVFHRTPDQSPHDTITILLFFGIIGVLVVLVVRFFLLRGPPTSPGTVPRIRGSDVQRGVGGLWSGGGSSKTVTVAFCVGPGVLFRMLTMNTLDLHPEGSDSYPRLYQLSIY
jgi:hypothetical protein